MQTKLKLNWMSRTAIIAGAFAFASFQPNAIAAQRPISDFVSRQGTYCLVFNTDGSVNCQPRTGEGCFLFLPPTPNFTGFSDPNAQLSASVDYAGLMNETLQSLTGGQCRLGQASAGQSPNVLRQMEPPR